MLRPPNSTPTWASVRRFAAQLDCVPIRVSESKIELVPLEVKRPVFYYAFSQEASFEHEGTTVQPTSLVGHEGIGGKLAARAAVEPDRFRQDRISAAWLVRIDRKLEGGVLTGKLRPDRPYAQRIIAEAPVLLDTASTRSEAGPTGVAFSVAALSRDALSAASPAGSGGSGWSDFTAATIRSISAGRG